MVDNLYPLNLDKYFNNNGISFDSNRAIGNFDDYCQSFPGEELPESNSYFTFEGVSFSFPDKKRANNIAFEKQEIFVPQNKYKFIHILGAAEGGSFQDVMVLNYMTQQMTVEIGLSDFFASEPSFNEKKAIICTHYHSVDSDQIGNLYKKINPKIWYQKYKLNSNKFLSSILLGDNPCMHIFCITLQS